MVVVFLWLWCFLWSFSWLCPGGGLFEVEFFVCGGVFEVAFLWWCFCGGVLVVVFL